MKVPEWDRFKEAVLEQMHDLLSCRGPWCQVAVSPHYVAHLPWKAIVRERLMEEGHYLPAMNAQMFGGGIDIEAELKTFAAEHGMDVHMDLTGRHWLFINTKDWKPRAQIYQEESDEAIRAQIDARGAPSIRGCYRHTPRRQAPSEE